MFGQQESSTLSSGLFPIQEESYHWRAYNGSDKVISFNILNSTVPGPLDGTQLPSFNNNAASTKNPATNVPNSPTDIAYRNTSMYVTICIGCSLLLMNVIILVIICWQKNTNKCSVDHSRGVCRLHSDYTVGSHGSSADDIFPQMAQEVLHSHTFPRQPKKLTFSDEQQVITMNSSYDSFTKIKNLPNGGKNDDPCHHPLLSTDRRKSQLKTIKSSDELRV